MSRLLSSKHPESDELDEPDKFDTRAAICNDVRTGKHGMPGL